jgi:hypothetical protein
MDYAYLELYTNNFGVCEPEILNKCGCKCREMFKEKRGVCNVTDKWTDWNFSARRVLVH